MAYETGTATDHDDLLAKLITFLTTNVDLVAASEQWTQAWAASPGDPNESAVVLQGPGLAGGDAILVGMQVFEDIPNEYYELQFVGMTDVIASAVQLDEHVNVTPYHVKHFADPNPMTYWFIANGRRFIVLTKVSTVYEASYCGLMLPYSLPTDYEYPLFIGGNAVDTANAAKDWRDIGPSHTNFANPYSYDESSGEDTLGNSWLLLPDGTWDWVAGTTTGAVTGWINSHVLIHPAYSGTSPIPSPRESPTMNEALGDMLSAFGGDVPTMPITLFRLQPQEQVLGILDGVVACAGIGNASENVLTGTEDYLVFQNTFRTSTNQYNAVNIG